MATPSAYGGPRAVTGTAGRDSRSRLDQPAWQMADDSNGHPPAKGAYGRVVPRRREAPRSARTKVWRGGRSGGPCSRSGAHRRRDGDLDHEEAGGHVRDGASAIPGTDEFDGLDATYAVCDAGDPTTEFSRTTSLIAFRDDAQLASVLEGDDEDCPSPASSIIFERVVVEGRLRRCPPPMTLPTWAPSSSTTSRTTTSAKLGISSTCVRSCRTPCRPLGNLLRIHAEGTQGST